jgi:hypothetical protein
MTCIFLKKTLNFDLLSLLRNGPVRAGLLSGNLRVVSVLCSLFNKLFYVIYELHLEVLKVCLNIKMSVVCRINRYQSFGDLFCFYLQSRKL